MTHNETLTLHEAEQLCQMYMDCRLSVLEEAELRYVLAKLPYATPLINETRMLMRLQGKPAPAARPRRPGRTWMLRAVCAAAVAAACIVTPLCLLHDDGAPAESVCIAYAHGRKLHGDAAEAQLEQDMARMKQFMQEIDNIQDREEENVKEFMNKIPAEK